MTGFDDISRDFQRFAIIQVRVRNGRLHPN